MNMREEVNMQQNNYQAHVEAARVAELEAAQAAAQAALMAEMDLLRRQKHGAEQHARDLEEQVSLQEFAQDRTSADKHLSTSIVLVRVSYYLSSCCTYKIGISVYNFLFSCGMCTHDAAVAIDISHAGDVSTSCLTDLHAARSKS